MIVSGMIVEERGGTAFSLNPASIRGDGGRWK